VLNCASLGNAYDSAAMKTAIRTLALAICAVVSWFCWGLPAERVAAQAQPGIVASPWAELHASRARLVAGRARIPPGHYLGGLEIGLDDGWKTYWRMPGDGGVPPSFDWSGSVNVGAIKVLYPAPVRLPEANGVSIGYKKSVLLPIEVTPQDPAKPVALKLALEFGVCRDICIPATAALELTIPVGSKGAAPPELVAASERVPRPQQARRKDDPELKRIAIEREAAASPRLTIEADFGKGAKGADVFVEAPEGFYVPVPKRISAADASGVLRFESDLGNDLAADLKGKTLTITLVGDSGSGETRWTVP
jgi:DsbC/DsbD-like thiol-disulfide interchange protein